MKRDIVIFGNTEYSYMIAKYMSEINGNRILAFTVNKKYIDKPYFHEYPVVPFEEIEKLFSPDDAEFIVAVGYKAMNSVREAIYNQIKLKNYRIGSFIHPNSNVEAAKLGEGNIILSGAYIGRGTVIGNANIFWNKCNISHDAVIGDFNYFAPSAVLGGFVKISNKCFFGLGSIVKNGVSISDSTLIGAGAYIDRSTAPADVYVPARSVKLSYKSSEMNI